MSLYKACRDLSIFKRFLYKTWKAWHSRLNKKLYLLQVEVCEVYSLLPLRFSHLLLHIAFLRRVVQQFLLPEHRNINSSFRSDIDQITNLNHTKQSLDESRQKCASNIGLTQEPSIVKDSDYVCYCACVLHISRYSGFPWVMPTNTGIFLRGLKLCGEIKNSKCSWYPK